MLCLRSRNWNVLRRFVGWDGNGRQSGCPVVQRRVGTYRIGYDDIDQHGSPTGMSLPLIARGVREALGASAQSRSPCGAFLGHPRLPPAPASVYTKIEG